MLCSEIPKTNEERLTEWYSKIAKFKAEAVLNKTLENYNLLRYYTFSFPQKITPRKQ